MRKISVTGGVLLHGATTWLRAIFLFSAFLTFCRNADSQIQGINPSEISCYVFSDTDTMVYMSRFSLESPGVFTQTVPARSCYGNIFLTNRPWMYVLSNWGSMGRYSLGTIDTATGKYYGIAMFNLSCDGARLACYDRRANKVYYVTDFRFGTGAAGWWLNSLDLNTWEDKLVLSDADPVVLPPEKSKADTLYSFAVSGGVMYGLSSKGTLRRIDLSTGKKTVVGKTGLNDLITGAAMYPDGGKLYIIAVRNGNGKSNGNDSQGNWFTDLREMDISTAGQKLIATWPGKYRNIVIALPGNPPPLEAPVLKEPWGFTNTVSPRLEWEAVEDAEKYYLQISADGIGVSRCCSYTGFVYGTSYQTGLEGTFKPNETSIYYWRVSAVDKNGLGEFSEPNVFWTARNRWKDIPGTDRRFLYNFTEQMGDSVQATVIIADKTRREGGSWELDCVVYCGKNKIKTKGWYNKLDKKEEHKSLEKEETTEDVLPGTDNAVIYDFFCR